MRRLSLFTGVVLSSLWAAYGGGWALAGSLLPAGDIPSSSGVDATLGVVLSEMADKALIQVPPSILAEDGLAQLSVLDPALRVDHSSNRTLRLFVGDHLEGEYPAPPVDDAQGWGDATQRLISQARRQSQVLRQMSEEAVRSAVMEGVLSRQDRFTHYAPPDEAEERRANRNGFGGIGVRLEPREDDFVLSEVLAGTPADQAHLQSGDHLLAVDGRPIGGLPAEAVSHLMRGPVDSRIALTVRGRGQQKASVITLIRSHIVPPTVQSQGVRDGIAVLSLSGFTEASRTEMVRALEKLRAAPELRGLILDLRGNPGGLLDQAVMIADLFMASGPIVSTRGRHPDSLQAYEAHPGDMAEAIPLAVLVDGKTASAAEVLAAALQDSGRAVVVGTNTFGKGTVQTVLTLPNQGELTLTWSRYYSPSGYSIHDLGVLPVVCSQGDSRPEEAGLLLADLDPPGGPLPGRFAAWRSVAVDQGDLRRRLRLSCPGEDRLADPAMTVFDQDVARRLLLSTDRMMKALALSAPSR